MRNNELTKAEIRRLIRPQFVGFYAVAGLCLAGLIVLSVIVL